MAKVVILGGGSAGISAASEFKKSAKQDHSIEVTLVDEKNYHHVLALTYQIVTGSVAPGHISFPVRRILRGGHGNRVNFVQGRVEEIDVERKVARTSAGELSWDYLVVALGGTSNFFGMKDVESHALTFRSQKDGIRLHNHIVQMYEAAMLEEDEQRCRELLTFVVVGGGPTGVELAASIMDFTDKVLTRDYPSLTEYLRVVLIEAQDKLLSGLKEKMGELALAGLESRGVEVMMNSRISRTGEAGVETADGKTIPTRTVVWAAGIGPADAVATMPFEKARDGRIKVDEYLEVPGSQGVYAVGDCAYSLQPDGSGPYPATHQVAIEQGPACARNIIRTINGDRQLPFRYRFMGQLVYLGRNTAVAQILGIVFNGLTAASLRRGLYLWMVISYLGLLMGLKNKLSVALDWSFAYFYRRNTARIE